LPYCRKCGAEISDEDAFCPSCGAPAGKGARRRSEKSEKEEKGEEKSEKEEKEGEKHEKGEHDRSAPLVGGGIIILLGTLLLLTDADIIGESDIWAYFLIGIGLILVLRGIYKYKRGYHGTGTGSLIGGAVLCAVGGGSALDIERWWAVMFIIVGVAIIAWAYSVSRRSPEPP